MSWSPTDRHRTYRCEACHIKGEQSDFTYYALEDEYLCEYCYDKAEKAHQAFIDAEEAEENANDL